MKSSEDKFYMNLQEYGNTSAASIPLALGEMNEKGMLRPGDKIYLCWFWWWSYLGRNINGMELEDEIK